MYFIKNNAMDFKASSRIKEKEGSSAKKRNFLQIMHMEIKGKVIRF